MWLKIIFVFTIYKSLTTGTLLDLSWRELTKERFFTENNGAVDSRVEKVTELNLASNNFDNFVDCLAKFDKLEVLDLSRNKLETFYFACENNNNLYKLNVSHNRLRILNDTALSKQLTKLRILDLSHNLMDLVTHQTFQHLEKLESLALNANPIRNRIHADSFKNLKILFDLNLSNISASNLPTHLFTPLIKLHHLSLASNPLVTLPGLPAGIKELDVSSTNIFRFEKLNLPNLKILIMNSMPYLESLDLNQFEKLKNLIDLSIDNSPRFKKLTALPTRNDLLPNIDRIHLRNCSIDNLGIDLQSIMKKISILNLQDNPWNCNCDIKWMLSLNSTKNNENCIRCRTPKEFHNQCVFHITDEEFLQCEKISYLGLWLALVFFCLAGLFATIFYLAREPIRKLRIKSNRDDTVTYKNMITKSDDTDKILDQSDIID